MALQLLTKVGAGVHSKVLDIRSVGSRMVPFIVFAQGNDHDVVVEKTPVADGSTGFLVLGTIGPGGGQVKVDEPIDYVRVSTDAAEGGQVSAFVTTSR